MAQGRKRFSGAVEADTLRGAEIRGCWASAVRDYLNWEAGVREGGLHFARESTQAPKGLIGSRRSWHSSPSRSETESRSAHRCAWMGFFGFAPMMPLEIVIEPCGYGVLHGNGPKQHGKQKRQSPPKHFHAHHRLHTGGTRMGGIVCANWRFHTSGLFCKGGLESD